jgi:hypothetical protein
MAGGAESKAVDVAVGGDGASYIIGDFSGKMTLDQVTLTTQGDAIFVAKLKPAGTCAWARKTTGSGKAKAHGVAVDGKRNVYLVGTFSGTLFFEGYTSTKLTTTGGEEQTFVIKLNSSGWPVWAVQLAVPGWDEARTALAVSAKGEITLAGTFSGQATVGAQQLTAAGWGTDAYVARLDETGKAAWAVALGGKQDDDAQGIAVDGAGNSHVIGNFGGTVTYGSTTLTAQGLSDVFVARLDKLGQVGWVGLATSKNYIHGMDIAVDDGGGSTITGHFSGEASFDKHPLSAAPIALFLARLDDKGVFEWATTASSGGAIYGNAVAVRGSGDGYVTGRFGDDEGYHATFGDTTLGPRKTSTTSWDLYVARFNSGGKWLWATSAGVCVGSESCEVTGVGMDAKDNGTIAGHFQGTLSFGATELAAQGTNTFVARVHVTGAK